MSCLGVLGVASVAGVCVLLQTQATGLFLRLDLPATLLCLSAREDF